MMREPITMLQGGASVPACARSARAGRIGGSTRPSPSSWQGSSGEGQAQMPASWNDSPGTARCAGGLSETGAAGRLQEEC